MSENDSSRDEQDISVEEGSDPSVGESQANAGAPEGEAAADGQGE